VALIEAGVKEVVYACADPNPAKSGGSSRLLAAGVLARESHASPAASSLRFRARIRTQTVNPRTTTRRTTLNALCNKSLMPVSAKLSSAVGGRKKILQP
jgi:hypothetical protein